MMLKLTCLKDKVLVHYKGEALEIHPFFVDRFCQKWKLVKNNPDNSLMVEYDGELKIKDYDGVRH
jgi:hypothetical protein